MGQVADYGQGQDWNELLKEVITFDSVEEFWGVYVSCRMLFHCWNGR